MKILIIEDERPAAKRLTQLIVECQPSCEIVETIDSVEGAVKYLTNFQQPDLIFMDIQLADGLSFDIFSQTEVQAPVIFTTAYDQYTLKAFKVNSIDYLLKPIDPEELVAAFVKYEKLNQGQNNNVNQKMIAQLVANLSTKSYKERFLVKIGQQLNYIAIEDIAYFFSEDGFVHAQTFQNKRHILDYTLDQLEGLIDPKDFFRINRKMVIKLPSIKKIHTYFNSRLKLELLPASHLEVIVSRDRVSDFKQWLDN